MDVDAVIAEARRMVGDGPTYISFDVDGLDPVYAPGTGTPEIGGDVVEVSPPFDQTGNTARVGATLKFEILCLLAECNGRH